jgi:diguanylate cyclase (GGDEF)-like protein
MISRPPSSIKRAVSTLVNGIKPNDHLMLVFTDLNNFKLVNDVYGHIMGDKILRAFADCLMKEKPGQRQPLPVWWG